MGFANGMELAILIAVILAVLGLAAVLWLFK
jgi:hypothetical protein